MAVQISDNAKTHLLKLGVDEQKFLRITVVPGGCSGSTYSAAVDDTLRRDDQVVYREGSFRAVADLQSILHLNGLHIDYSDDLIRSGFRFTNPNAAKSCGCGASFQL